MTNKGVFMGVAIILASGAGLAAVVLNARSGEITGGPILVAQATEAVEEMPREPTQAQQAFQSMAVDADLPECLVPKPPKHIGETALTRNSLRQVLRILAFEKSQTSGVCACPFDDVSWEDVVAAAPNFERTDGVDLRFDLSDLRARGDALEALNLQSCPK